MPYTAATAAMPDAMTAVAATGAGPSAAPPTPTRKPNPRIAGQGSPSGRPLLRRRGGLSRPPSGRRRGFRPIRPGRTGGHTIPSKGRASLASTPGTSDGRGTTHRTRREDPKIRLPWRSTPTAGWDPQARQRPRGCRRRKLKRHRAETEGGEPGLALLPPGNAVQGRVRTPGAGCRFGASPCRGHSPGLSSRWGRRA